MSFVDVPTEIDISKPIAVVSGGSLNPDNAPVWYVNIKSAEWKTAPQLRVGTQVALLRAFWGVVWPIPMKSSTGYLAIGSSRVRRRDHFQWKRHIHGNQTLMAART